MYHYQNSEAVVARRTIQYIVHASAIPNMPSRCNKARFLEENFGYKKLSAMLGTIHPTTMITHMFTAAHVANADEPF